MEPQLRHHNRESVKLNEASTIAACRSKKNKQKDRLTEALPFGPPSQGSSSEHIGALSENLPNFFHVDAKA